MKEKTGPKVKACTVRISPSGILRISSDLIPTALKGKAIAFVVKTHPNEKLGGRVVLTPHEQNGNGSGISGEYVLKAWMSGPKGKCPLVSALAIIRSLNMDPPKKKPRTLAAKKNKDGSIEFEIGKVGL